MINDQGVKSAIARDWRVVRRFCEGSHRQWLSPGGGFINETPPEDFYNLPFLLAYAILDQVLDELLDQGAFQCHMKRPLLGDKMFASRELIPWRDYDLVNTGRRARNELAHEAKLLPRDQCFAFIDAIEAELKGWGIL